MHWAFGGMLVYKILRAVEWADFERDAVTKGAPIDLADGYIHLSTAKQVAETAAKHFAGADDLRLLALDPTPLGDALKWETSRNDDLFPHLYRPMTMDDVLWARDLPLGPDGHDFPQDMT